MKILLYSAFLLFLAPCNASKKAASAETAPDANFKTVSFLIEKTPCFGRCPQFVLSISGETHKATYTGKQNVDKIGTFQKNITDAELKTLVDAFEKAKFMDMKDAYNKEGVTDLPSIYVTYSINGKTKKVQDRYQAPAELKELEKLLDAIGNREGWEKSEEGK